MSFFDIIALLGGLAMFLYGMRLMGDSLKEDSSGTLKKFMEKVTNNPVKAFLLGLAVTAIIQSSTATIVLTSGLVAAGILTLHQSLGIIVGANVGTTVTGQIIRLLDVDAGSTSILRVFQPSTLAPLALVIGIILIMFVKRGNSGNLGNVFIGFGILFTGLMNMTAAVSVLSENGVIDSLFSAMGDNMLLGYLIGAGVAFLLQSSSATIGILQAFALSTSIPFKSTYIVLVGVYLGDCVTTFMVCAIGAKADAKRVGVVNILYNIGKTVLVLLVVTILHMAGALNSLWEMPMTPGTIANTNTIINLACAVVLLPFVGVIEKLSRLLVKDEPVPVSKYAEELNGLNPVFFSTPALALNSCYNVLKAMLTAAIANVGRSLELIRHFDRSLYKTVSDEEDSIDHLTDALSGYMTQLSPYLIEDYQMRILFQYNKLVTNFERLGDHAMNLAETAEKLSRSGTVFSDKALYELQVTGELLNQIFEYTDQAFEKRDVTAAETIEPLEEVMDDLVNTLHDNHLERIRTGECTSHTGIYFLDVLSNLERISDICSNIGVSVITRVRPEIESLAHNYISSLHQGNEDFENQYNMAHDKYFNMLQNPPVQGAAG